MFPFRENHSFTVHDEMGKEPYDEEAEKDKVISCDEVSSSDDVFENANSFENFDMLDNFNPSLFCPDIILELEDTPIIINDASDLTAKENEVRRKAFGPVNPVQYTKIHCTACNDHLGSSLSEQDNRFVHPLLKVLICRECYEFYTSGEFEKEEDGSEVYCRWCGQGGQVVCCSRCQFVFCTTCIRTNLGRKKLVEIKGDDDWACFGCDPSQIIELRGHCAEFMEYVEKEISRVMVLANARSLMTTDYSKCCSKSETATIEKRGKGSADPNYDPYNKENSSRKFSSSSKNTLYVDAPKETLTMSGAEMSIGDNQNGMANANVKKTVTFSVSTITPTFSTPSNSPSFYPLSSNLRQMKIPPNNQKPVTTNNKPQTSQTVKNVPLNAPFQNTIPISCTTHGDIQSKKFFYEKMARSASNINTDLSRELTKMMESKRGPAGLEGMVVVHNRLQDALNKSINCLLELQKELAGHKPGISETKFTHSTTTNQITNNFNRHLFCITNDCENSNRSSAVKGLQNIKIVNENK